MTPATESSPHAPGAWRRRIVGHGTESPEQLLANPANWRIHPQVQQDVLEGLINEIGFTDPVKVNQRTGYVVDGHLRVMLALKRNEPAIDVIYLDLDEAEEKLALASHDAVATLAVRDDAKMRELLADTTGFASNAMLRDAIDFGEADPDHEARAAAQAAALEAVALPDPQHLVYPGDVWAIGRHALVCSDPIADVGTWLPVVTAAFAEHGDRLRVCPFAGPYLAVSKKALGELVLVLLQPSPYLAGHTLDLAQDVHDGASIRRLIVGSDPALEPSDDDIAPTFQGAARVADGPKKRHAA